MVAIPGEVDPDLTLNKKTGSERQEKTGPDSCKTTGPGSETMIRRDK